MENLINKIHCGDCLKLFPKVPDDSVDVVFSDSPFNLEKDYKTYDDKLTESKYMDWCENWILECYRILRPGGSLFLHNIPKWLIKYCCILDGRFDFRHWICWDAPTSPMGKSLQPSHYGILYYTKPGDDITFHEIRRDNERCRECKVLKKDYGGKKDTIPPFGPLIGDVWSDIHRLKHPKYRNNHPCQLPVTLIERILLMSSDVGQIVLDPFMGTGTTAVAAKRLDRQFLGFELAADYVEMGTSRVNRQTIPSKIGDNYISCFNGQIVTARHEDIQEGKEYKESWKDLWEEWPDSAEKRIALNKTKMKLKSNHQSRIDELCEKLREN